MTTLLERLRLLASGLLMLVGHHFMSHSGRPVKGALLLMLGSVIFLMAYNPGESRDAKGGK